MRWNVIVTLKSVKTGEETEMIYLSNGDSFSTIHSVMSAMSNLDPEWVITDKITIFQVTEK